MQSESIEYRLACARVAELRALMDAARERLLALLVAAGHLVRAEQSQIFYIH